MRVVLYRHWFGYEEGKNIAPVETTRTVEEVLSDWVGIVPPPLHIESDIVIEKDFTVKQIKKDGIWPYNEMNALDYLRR